MQGMIKSGLQILLMYDLNLSVVGVLTNHSKSNKKTKQIH
jgi:hypothetical protein